MPKDQPAVSAPVLSIARPIRPIPTTSWTQVVRRKNKTLSPATQQPQVQQPQASQQSQASLKPKKKTPLEDRRILFTRDNKENKANT